MSEKLTRKAKQAIHTYMKHTEKKHMYIGYLAIEMVLKADRMPRADLYSLLERNNYRWNGSFWIQKTVKVKQQ